MAHDFLSLLSPTFRAKTKRTLERSQLTVEQLDNSYAFPPGGADRVMAIVRDAKGYTGKINRGIIYEDRVKYYHAYRYLHGDDDLRRRMDLLRTNRKKTEFLGLNSLLQDHPEIQTWEDVEQALATVAADDKEQDTSSAREEAQEEDKDAHDALADTATPLATVLIQITEAGEVMRRIATYLSAYVAQQRRQTENDQKRIADLQRENTHLRRRMEEWLRQGQTAAQGAAEIKELGDEISHRLLFATHNLPEATQVSYNGWRKELPIRYSGARDGFCERIQSDQYDKGEKQQIVKTLRRLAQHGPRSVNRETFRRPLPGIPPEIRDFTYGHASHDLRIAWKEYEDHILVLGIYKHVSGAKSSLPDIR